MIAMAPVRLTTYSSSVTPCPKICQADYSQICILIKFTMMMMVEV